MVTNFKMKNVFIEKQINYVVLATLYVGLFFPSCKKTENSATVNNTTEIEQ